MRIIIGIILLLIAKTTLTQTVVFDDNFKGIDFKSDESTNVCPIVYKDELRHYIISRLDEVTILDVSEEMKNIEKRITVNNFDDYTRFIGYTTSEQNNNLFFTNMKFNKFGFIQFSNDEMNTNFTKKLLDIELKKEEYVENFKINDDFYLMTIGKEPSTINLYKITEDGNFTRQTYDLSNYKQFKSYTFYELIRNIGMESLYNRFDVGKVEENASLSQTYQYVKLYVKDDKVLITIDNNFNYTDLFTIDTKLENIKYEQIDRQVNDIKLRHQPLFNFNSFILDDNIYQILLSEKQMKLDVINLTSKELLKSYQLYDDENKEITFSNSETIKKGGLFVLDVIYGYVTPKKNKVEEINSDKKFIKKIYGDNVALSVYNNGNKSYLKIGSYEYKEVNSAIYALTKRYDEKTSKLFDNKTYGLFGIKAEREYYFNLILDTNLNYINEEYEVNNYDILYNYYKSNAKLINDESIFKLGSNLYLSYYNSETNKFNILKF